MAHTEAHPKTGASRHPLLGKASSSMAAAVAAFVAWRRTIAGRRALADLTPHELRDIGCPELSAPKFVVRVGLMTDLMSMR
ncbi:DUF1127 domain-containing protein [Mesorhizobium sp. M2D.F.Ca.ET.185.01.1.1]|uniref:DUF1127 domain-containing protein n=1 Tax=unclassified Mesorhizobium TaxID=325217 RepID=UPI000FCC47E6|nr:MULTISPECIES: DUF1127 domain-containing protein [unclassified Mesorhizobium]TGP49849.1 DUF1127 domain-containing protein [bacterium M00.F.Ca.ET.230.01.1.1]TGP67124.1 DUF1127 domain-containing protein [Mesorhizobium sp. M2D.F.Ca.ET.225.01.1.1]TGP78977.1 DUF1127 domain-containing protein [bacterium M00.F.Ca.ET.227.01.1.1]TGP89494.1 DUF1127 domain-containing protein [bacterium M00.F.Ca.ET.221.01.1.1]TGP94862.1 DUF1127 domain-containing protein [bacterium M00.F.Ca.ET.222.01.1.1]TGT71205.1 DUF1